MAAVGFMGAYLSGIGTGVGSVVAGRMGRRHSVTAEEMRALSTGIALPRPQTVYLDTVCALMEVALRL